MPILDRWVRSEYNHLYYIRNEERLREKRQGIIFCSLCDKYISKINILKHQRRKVHIQLFEISQKRNYIDKILSQKFDSGISKLIASFIY